MNLRHLPSGARDFDFAIGEWHVQHRRLKSRLDGCTEWVEFEGFSSTRKILGGFGNVEDNVLELPTGSYRAAAVRSFDAENGWSIWWLDGRDPTTLGVPVVGCFEGGVGQFFANDTLDGRPIQVRLTWTVHDRDHPRWEQAFSADGGRTWETNWRMEFTRAEALDALVA
ncbi:MAG: DUF1579 domain-containing protein [Paucibacter sp.]|nr:DUF1579 domain-containing protein [Roseateles sp.]